MPEPADDYQARLAAALRPLPPSADAPALWQALGDAGLLTGLYRRSGGLLRPELHHLRFLLTELDRGYRVGATLGVCVPAATVVPLLAEAASSGTTASAALTGALAGRSVIGLAVTDQGSGSDLTALESVLEMTGEEITVTGTKRWITNATWADRFLVLARHREGRHFTNFSLVLVPCDAEGVHVEPAPTTAFDGSGVGHVHFDRVRVPRACLVGRLGYGLVGFARHIATERLAGALWGAALCRRALADTAERLGRRDFSDATLRDQPVVRDRLARAAVHLCQHDALCRELGPAIIDRFDAASAAVLKASLADTADEVLGTCARLQGADGFGDGGAQRLRTEAAVFGIGGGTAELVLATVADHLDAILAGTP